jgi:hypothetical protein
MKIKIVIVFVVSLHFDLALLMALQRECFRFISEDEVLLSICHSLALRLIEILLDFQGNVSAFLS